MTKEIRERLDVARWMAARLSGTINKEDNTALDGWLARSPENESEWEEIREAVRRGEIDWNARRTVNREWKRFAKRIPVRKRGIISKWSYAAAVVLLIVGGIYARYGAKNTLLETPEVDLEHAAPGMANARLVMHDGVTVELAPNRDTLIRGEKGETIATEARSVIYPLENEIAGVGENVYHTLIVTHGAEFSLRLSDSTMVWLNAGSRLRYPIRFAGATREVELDGEGYFEVNGEAERGFVVKVGEVRVQVLGTRFNVSSHDNRIVTTLIEGKVQLTAKNETVTLLPDQQAILEEGGERFAIKRVAASNFALWKEGVFWFEDAELETILERVARWYDARLVYEDNSVKGLRFSMEMKRYDNIRVVLQKLEQTRKVKFTLHGQTIYISK